MNIADARDGIDGMEELDFCERVGLEDEYFKMEDWRKLFLENYKLPSEDEPTTSQSAKPEKRYTTKALIERLNNALENGYEELGETDIGDLLLETEQESLCPHCDASPCLGEFDSSDC